MKTNKIMTLPVLMFLSLMVAGPAAAQEAEDITDQQYCEQDAEEAGMRDAEDIREFVQQCLEEFRMQNEESGESDDSSTGDDSSSRE